VSLSDRDWSGFDRGHKNRQCWDEAWEELVAAGFVEGAAEFERFVMDRDGAHVEGLGITGARGSWYGVVTRDGVRRGLRGPKGGLRVFRTATACLAALEREIRGEPEILGMVCGKHSAEEARKILGVS
jgi:hypothetical protein